MSTNAAPGSHRHARVLACVLCQHRKIKCDRNTPCSNCLKANVTCTPSTPAPARKRRRPNQDLQERLARCEELLKQYAGGSVPTSGPTPGGDLEMKSPVTPATNDTPSEYTPYSPCGDSNPSWKGTGKMVKEDGNVRFMDSFLWSNVYDELQAMKDIVDTEEPEDASAVDSEGFTPENQSDLFFSSETASLNIEDLQPDAVYVFRLWQLYLDRVNPISKIVHVPTMQPYVMDATTNMSNIPLNYQALLFAIFTMATVSLSENECIQMLGLPREKALQRFSRGTKLALGRLNFFKNHDMATLQAFVIYLNSLEGRHDRHATWVMAGTAIRIAQKMGYHRDGELLNLTPFETEMRRRIWYHIIMIDSHYAMLSGLGHSLSVSNWDTKEPRNVNDADLFPGSTEPVHAREGPTEMGFCLLTYHFTRFRHLNDSKTDSRVFEAAVLGHDLAGENGDGSSPTSKNTFERLRDIIRDLQMQLKEVEDKYIDEKAGPTHVFAKIIRPMFADKVFELLKPMQEQPEWGTEIFGQKDNLFKVMIMSSEHHMDVCDQMANSIFYWFMRVHFHLDMFQVMTGQLCQRPMGSLADRAWKAVQRVYTHHSELFDLTRKPSAVQAQFTLKAWKAREQAYALAGQTLQVPQYIHRLQESLPAHDTRSGPPSVTPPPITQLPQGNGSGADMDQFMGGYLDTSTLNWDVWGNMPSNGDQISAMFGGYGFNGLNNMGNMSL